jgi:glucose-1-phosphate adenylyltransferase
VLGRAVHVQSGGFVEDSIVLDNCIIGLQCRIRRAILDENVTLGDGVSVGYKLEQDRACYHVTETGIVVVTSRTANSISSPASTASAAGLS